MKFITRLNITQQKIPSLLYNRWVNWRAGHLVMKRNILGFCGIKTVRITEFSPVSSSTEAMLAKWLEKVSELGASLA
ncbi:hypothetical protein [Paenibacillus sp. TH7-28]